MVEGTGFENRQGRNPLVSSNLTSSAEDRLHKATYSVVSRTEELVMASEKKEKKTKDDIRAILLAGIDGKRMNIWGELRGGGTVRYTATLILPQGGRQTLSDDELEAFAKKHGFKDRMDLIRQAEEHYIVLGAYA